MGCCSQVLIANLTSFTDAPLALGAGNAWLQVGKERTRNVALFATWLSQLLHVYTSPLSFGGGGELYSHYQPAGCCRGCIFTGNSTVLVPCASVCLPRCRKWRKRWAVRVGRSWAVGEKTGDSLPFSLEMCGDLSGLGTLGGTRSCREPGQEESCKELKGMGWELVM